MSGERIIHLADLSAIKSGLNAIGRDLETLSTQVHGVQGDVDATRSELARLQQAFMDFVAADLMAKELSLAETRQVKIRQELETRFGHHADVRRQTTGILQAADIQLVRQDTIRAATEQLMLAAPGYWLAPALVALASWLSDNRELAERALSEALRRDDEKTSLLFALVCRRAGRLLAAQQWMDRYLALQNPVALERQTVVLIDAIAAGVFGVDMANACLKRTGEWIDELSQRAGFVDEQRQQWIRALRFKTPSHDDTARFPHLHKHSATWPELQEALNNHATHAAVTAHFQGVFEGPARATASLVSDVDALLDKLVARFDGDELPLRRDEELCRLIIEENGNRDVARQRYALQEKALEDQVSFTQLLTNAAMHPETSHASRTTQRFATALSRSWILDAHHDLTAQFRVQVPVDISVAIDGWQGSTRDGSNQAELEASLNAHVDVQEQAALAAVKLTWVHWCAVALGAMLLLFGFGSVVAMAMGAGIGLWVFWVYKNLDKQRAQVRERFAQARQACQQRLKACLAETVELRRELARRDAESETLTALLESISPEQFTLGGHDTARRLLATA